MFFCSVLPCDGLEKMQGNKGELGGELGSNHNVNSIFSTAKKVL